MTIYLIRHGRTRANEAHLYCGSTDLPLSPGGRAALQRCPRPEGVRYLTSGMRRCNETLALLFGPVPWEAESDFREIDFGAFEMRSYAQLRQDPAYLRWLAGDNEANTPPGGESGVQMTRRVLAAFDRLAAAGQDTVLVTHGGVIAAILAALFPEEGRSRYEWQPAPGSGCRLTGGPGSWRREPFP